MAQEGRTQCYASFLRLQGEENFYFKPCFVTVPVLLMHFARLPNLGQHYLFIVRQREEEDIPAPIKAEAQYFSYYALCLHIGLSIQHYKINFLIMNKYYLHLTLKTRVLNFFRRFFILPMPEGILVKQCLKNSSSILEKLIPPNYLYKKPALRTVKRNGITFKLDISDVMDHYIYWGYRERGYNSILEVLKNAKVLMDVGANIGDTALFYASINPGAAIYAFEPHPRVFKKSVENVELNNFSNIHLINSGLGEQQGIFKLYEVNENNAAMNRIIAEEKKLPYQEVTVQTLDRVVEERHISKIDFIKLDVEGYEHAVLLGGKNTITKSKPVMFIELDDSNLVENNSSARALIQTLQSYGYSEIYRADNLTPISVNEDFNNCHYDIIAK